MKMTNDELRSLKLVSSLYTPLQYRRRWWCGGDEMDLAGGNQRFDRDQTMSVMAEFVVRADKRSTQFLGQGNVNGIVVGHLPGMGQMRRPVQQSLGGCEDVHLNAKKIGEGVGKSSLSIGECLNGFRFLDEPLQQNRSVEDVCHRLSRSFLNRVTVSNPLAGFPYLRRKASMRRAASSILARSFSRASSKVVFNADPFTALQLYHSPWEPEGKWAFCTEIRWNIPRGRGSNRVTWKSS